MRRFVWVLLIAALYLPYSSTNMNIALGSEWSQFRGPGGNAKADDTGLPTSWSDSQNLVWKAALPGRGASSPVVAGDHIYLTAWTGYGLDTDAPGDKAKLRLHVLCLDRDGGAVLWNQSIAASAREQKLGQRVADHGYATPTPACDELGVYAYFGVSGLVAYDHDGEKLWQAHIGDKTAGFGTASSPIVFRNLVIVNGSIEGGAVFAFDRKTGKEVWKQAGIVRTWTTPTIGDVPNGEPELIVNQKDNIYGFNPLTGEKLWTCEGIDDYVVPCAVVHEGVAYCLGGRTNRCLAVKLGGRGDVTKSHRLWKVNLGANVTSPIYHNGHLYWASDKGIAYCVDAKNGETLHRERLPTRARIYASAVMGDGKIYVTTRDSGVIVFKAQPSFDEMARNVLESDSNMFNATPAIHNGQLLLRSDSTLYCIGETGK